jgi:hypothetical protein
MARLQVDRKDTAIMGVPNLLTQCRQIATDLSPTGQVWFRGIQDVSKHSLVPSIGREHWFGGKSTTFDTESEKGLLGRFRRFARQFEGRALDEWEAMFLARHHGLPVRLMDWTANPLVAFYMACEHEQQNHLPNGCIWVLVPRNDIWGRLDILDSNGSPFNVRGIKLIDPMILSPRISVQGGIFTLHEDPRKPLDEFENIELNDDHLDVSHLIGYQILGQHKPMRLKELNDLGINRRTLFPDYDGLVRGLVSEAVLGKHAKELNQAIRASTPEVDKKVIWHT